MKDLTQESLANLVTANHKTASILEKYGLDFCCKGKTTLETSCMEKGLDVSLVSKELESVIGLGEGDESSAEKLSQRELIDRIVTRHHQYMKDAMPAIHFHLSKVSFKHGDRYPYMRQVLDLFDELKKEMDDHLVKEENVLFPIIAGLEDQQSGENQCFPWGREILTPVQVMLREHEHAGGIMENIRSLTGNYKAPENACMTFKLSLTELQDFESDLHRHVHLENYLLFPRFEEMMEARLRSQKRAS
jgi:regulator of cell morphogenesis and NO signaling